MESVVVSAVVLARNEQAHLERCLRSLQDQKTDFHFEIVIVDDASTDQTPSIIRRFTAHEKRARVITNSTHLGIGESANRGLTISRGRYVVRVDGDDFVSRHFLNFLCVAAMGNGVAAVRSDYQLVDEGGSPIQRVDSSKHPIACGILFAKEALIEVGLYDGSLRIHEDVELEQRFTQGNRILHLPVPLYRYRQHRGNSSGGWTQNRIFGDARK